MRVWDPITRREREHRLESIGDIEETARRVLRHAGVAGHLPTPVDPVLRALQLRLVPLDLDLLDRHSSRLASPDAESLQRAIAKTHGWTTEGLVWVRPTDVPGRARKVTFHECAHEALPWHKVEGLQLGSAWSELFDDEANAFASELLFQGSHFDAAAASMPACRNSILQLAKAYEAPWHDTLLRFVERRRDPLVLLVGDGSGHRVVAASESALHVGLDGDSSELHLAKVDSFNVGLRMVGVRRYELAIASRRAYRSVA